MSIEIIELASVPIERKTELAEMMQLYLAELALYSGDQPDQDGIYPEPYFDLYWQDPGRFPFFILQGGEVAGFVLVRQLVERPDPTVYSIAEFYVLPAFRRQGTGRSAARQAFCKFPGRWQVAQEARNIPAQVFWRRVIDEFCQGEVQNVDVPGWDGPVLEFNTP